MPSITQKDSLQETSANVTLAAHTPSGGGATGGAWSNITGAEDFESLASNAGYTGNAGAGAATQCVQAGATTATSNYAQVSCLPTVSNAAYYGVMLSDPTNTGHAYIFLKVGGGSTYQMFRYTNISTGVGLGSPVTGPFTLGTANVLKITRTVSGSTSTLNGYVDGTLVVGPITDSTSGYNVPMVAGLQGYESNTVTYTAFLAGDASVLTAPTPTLSTRLECDQIVATAGDFGGTPPLSIQWQYSLNGTTGWTNYGTGLNTQGLTGLAAGATRYIRYTVTDSVPNSVTSAAAGPATTLTNMLVVDGNSIGVGYPGYNVSNGLYTSGGALNPILAADEANAPCDIQAFLPTWAIYNMCYSSRPMTPLSSGVSGNPTVGAQTQTGNFAANVAPLLARGVAAGCTSIVVVNVAEPGNMIYYDQRGNDSLTETDAENSLIAYANLVKAAGALFATMTMPTRINATSPNNTNTTADIAAVNAWMRLNWSTFCSGAGFSDPASDWRFQNYNNSTYYADTTHFNATGYLALSGYLISAVLGAISAPGTSQLTLTVTASGSNFVLDWTADQLATSYNVERGTTNAVGTCQKSIIAQIAAGTLTYTDTTAPTSGSIYYAITANH